MTTKTILSDIRDTQNAVHGDASISSILRRVKILASKVNSDDLLMWTSLELDGYPKDYPETKLPEYRKIRQHILYKYQAFNVGSIISDQMEYHESQLRPDVHETTRMLFTKLLYQPIGVFEDVLSKENMFLASVMDTNIGHFFLHVSTAFKEEYYLVANRAEIVNVLERVKNIVIDSTIKIRKELGNDAFLEELEGQHLDMKNLLGLPTGNAITYVKEQYNQTAERIQGNQGGHHNKTYINENKESDAVVNDFIKLLSNGLNDLREHGLANQDLLLAVFSKMNEMNESVTSKILSGEVDRKEIISMVEPLFEKYVEEISNPKVKAFLKDNLPKVLFSLGVKSIIPF